MSIIMSCCQTIHKEIEVHIHRHCLVKAFPVIILKLTQDVVVVSYLFSVTTDWVNSPLPQSLAACLSRSCSWASWAFSSWLWRFTKYSPNMRLWIIQWRCMFLCWSIALFLVEKQRKIIETPCVHTRDETIILEDSLTNLIRPKVLKDNLQTVLRCEGAWRTVCNYLESVRSSLSDLSAS